MRTYRKPRLTENVMEGMGAVLAMVFSGDFLDGDLAPRAKEVHAFGDWYAAMHEYREKKRRGDR